MTKEAPHRKIRLIKKTEELRKELMRFRRKGLLVGLVPTMGALHAGHLSLVKRAAKENDGVVVSIFVNPLQFGANEDFKAYPRDLKKDMQLLEGLADIVFAPGADELYKKDFCTFVEVQGLSEGLCGSSRPGHFRGVATVVAKLFNIVGPDTAYFGQKDAQQALVIRKMVSDLNIPVGLKVMPIVREKDGLAMSSRNAYLSKEERKDASVLYQALRSAQRMVDTGCRETEKIKEALRNFIGHTASARIDYIEIVDKDALQPLKTVEQEALLLLAVFIGKTRLIDNASLRVDRR